MSNEKVTPADESTLPLWRVAYHWLTPQHTLRVGTYIYPAPNSEAAEAKTAAVLSNRFGKTYHRITKVTLF